jgi:hypothetical protein
MKYCCECQILSPSLPGRNCPALWMIGVGEVIPIRSSPYLTQVPYASCLDYMHCLAPSRSRSNTPQRCADVAFMVSWRHQPVDTKSVVMRFGHARQEPFSGQHRRIHLIGMHTGLQNSFGRMVAKAGQCATAWMPMKPDHLMSA